MVMSERRPNSRGGYYVRQTSGGSGPFYTAGVAEFKHEKLMFKLGKKLATVRGGNRCVRLYLPS